MCIYTIVHSFIYTSTFANIFYISSNSLASFLCFSYPSILHQSEFASYFADLLFYILLNVHLLIPLLLEFHPMPYPQIILNFKCPTSFTLCVCTSAWHPVLGRNWTMAALHTFSAFLLHWWARREVCWGGGGGGW